MSEVKIYKNTMNASLAHTCGNVTYTILNHLKEQFPKDFFKSTHIASRIAMRDFKKIDKNHFLDFKKEKPIISVIPRLFTNDKPAYNIEYQNPLFGRNSYDSTFPDWYVYKFFIDKDKCIQVQTQISRLKMGFEMSYVVGTDFQQYDLFGYISSKMRFERVYKLPALLETEIPIAVVKQISEHVKIPIFDDKGSSAEFLQYMNSISKAPIIYKLKTSTGKPRFFMLIETILMINMGDMPNLNEGSKEGMTNDDFTITHQLEVEFNYPASFEYFSVKPQQEIDKGDGETISTGEIQPVFTVQEGLIYSKSLKGYDLHVSVIIDTDDEKDDVTDISSLFTDSMLLYFDKMLEQGMDKDKLIEVSIFDADRRMEESEYTLDLVKREVTIHNTGQKSYRLFIYLNNLYINEYILKDYKY